MQFLSYCFVIFGLGNGNTTMSSCILRGFLFGFEVLFFFKSQKPFALLHAESLVLRLGTLVDTALFLGVEHLNWTVRLRLVLFLDTWRDKWDYSNVFPTSWGWKRKSKAFWSLWSPTDRHLAWAGLFSETLHDFGMESLQGTSCNSVFLLSLAGITRVYNRFFGILDIDSSWALVKTWILLKIFSVCLWEANWARLQEEAAQAMDDLAVYFSGQHVSQLISEKLWHSNGQERV